MATITISAYEIYIRPKGDKNTRINLSDFSNGHDLFVFLSEQLANLTLENGDIDLIDDEENKKVLRLEPNTLAPFGRQLSGILESGEYGYESKIIDRTNGQNVANKGLNHAELIPFYFQIFIPENLNIGIVLLQRFKQFGIFSIFSETLKRQFRESFVDFRLEINPLVSDEIVRSFIEGGELNRITFKTLNVTPEIIGQADQGHVMQGENARIEFSIVANKGERLPFLQRIRNAIVNGRVQNINGLFNINGIEYDKVSVTVKLNGRTRTMDLSSLANIGAFFDITDEVIMDENRGHPNLISIRAISNGIQDDLYNTIYPNENVVEL
jgi:hypothetical protein